MNHKNSKCIFFHEGMVLNDACDRVIAHCFCDLDEMEEDKPCTSDACRYYVRRKEARTMRKTITERKCICDFCGKEMYTDQKTGGPYCGANVRIILKRFFGLIKTETGDIDLCKECYCKLTGKTKEEVGW